MRRVTIGAYPSRPSEVGGLVDFPPWIMVSQAQKNLRHMLHHWLLVGYGFSMV